MLVVIFYAVCPLKKIEKKEKETLKTCYFLIIVSFYSFEDLGPDGSGRYSEHMMPEVDKQDFRKGSQVN